MDGARAQKMDNFAELYRERGHQVADITSGRIILQINIVPPPPPNTKYNTVTELSARKLRDIGE